MIQTLVWILIAVAPGLTEGATKIWTSNTNFANPDNWSAKRVPCSKDTVVFPAAANVAVFMPTSAAFKEIVLPMNGELIFPTDAVVRLDENTGDGSCPGDVIRFIDTEPKDWFNPSNWNVSAAAVGHVSADVPTLAVPHSEIIPCPQDHVVFPVGTSFRVRLEAVGATLPRVRSMEVNGQRLDSSSLTMFRTTSTGREMFVGDVDIIFSRDGCSDPTGCACGNDKREVLLRICSHVTSQCPSPLQCTDPIQPVGHCCPICGSQLLLEHKPGFKLEIVRHFFDTSFSKDMYKEVQGYMSKTHENKIQMVMVDSGMLKGAASHMTDMLYNFLKQDMEGHDLYRLKSAVRIESTGWLGGVPTFGFFTSAVEGPGAATVVGIVFGIFLLLGSAAAVYYIYRRRHIPGFAFARFVSDGGKIELELGTTPHEMLDPCDPGPPSSKTMATGFDNPIYGSPGAAQSLYGSDEKEADFQEGENPLFGKITDKDSQL